MSGDEIGLCLSGDLDRPVGGTIIDNQDQTVPESGGRLSDLGNGCFQRRLFVVTGDLHDNSGVNVRGHQDKQSILGMISDASHISDEARNASLFFHLISRWRYFPHGKRIADLLLP
ncbi:hypothetical protein LZ188_00835 [Rhodovulum sulfidophilum]|nr:hypothetical protein [Rhodovulum sulfidophilum]